MNLCSQVKSHPQSSESGNAESYTQPKPIDYDTLMIEVVEGINAKGKVYELSLDGSMCARASTSRSKKYSDYADIVRDLDEDELSVGNATHESNANNGRDAYHE
ncbi:hypothetical protein KIW84_052398 [Lathyrus oleraceus]|uniref:Uncharacterized protein n=1 Tax=Pisum sativum TaxID=3888 RepID=A0A9D5AEV1_PEA|nr:hypothetical protein KIW84_052398 [Pisum sativum]